MTAPHDLLGAVEAALKRSRRSLEIAIRGNRHLGAAHDPSQTGIIKQIDALLPRLRTALAAGAVIVPGQPTEEMLAAVDPSWMVDDKQRSAWRKEYARIYRAMLSAAPAVGEGGG